MQFAAAARLLTGEARRMGYLAPGFRSPPRVLGADRTIRRGPDGGIVAVSLRGRPFVAVLADMVEGVVVLNQLVPPEADRLRAALWSMLGEHGVVADTGTTQVA